MLTQGTNLYAVSEMLSHSIVAVTKDVYGHLVEDQKRAAAPLMSAALLAEIGSQRRSSALWRSSAPHDMALARPNIAHPEGFEPPTF